jgi:hypothetical protein
MPNRQSCDASCVTQKRKERNTQEKIEEKTKKNSKIKKSNHLKEE